MGSTLGNDLIHVFRGLVIEVCMQWEGVDGCNIAMRDLFGMLDDITDWWGVKLEVKGARITVRYYTRNDRS